MIPHPNDMLGWIGARGRYCLIAGLVAGLALPGLAEALRPWVGELITLLLVVTGLRVGARAAMGSLQDLRPALVRIGALQVALPMTALAVFAALGWLEVPLAIAVALMLSAPSVTGAPNFAVMLGQDPAPGMRLLILGTAVFPLTALPVLTVLSGTGAGAIGQAALLLVVILGAVGLGFALRAGRPALAARNDVLDGIAAILLGVVVVGLMAAIGPLVRSAPITLLGWILAVMAIHLSQTLTALFVTRRFGGQMAIPTAIYAGNRNLALYLIVLPPDVAAPLMIFVGCYQIPMYLTPMILARLT